VLGRRTYEIFEAYWPLSADDHPIAKTLNAAEKVCCFAHINDAPLEQFDPAPRHVVSAITALKTRPGPDLQIIGSGNLIQTLQAASLIDEYKCGLSVVLGGQAPLWRTAKPSALRLVRSQVSTTGVVMSTYVPGAISGRFVRECRAE